MVFWCSPACPNRLPEHPFAHSTSLPRVVRVSSLRHPNSRAQDIARLRIRSTKTAYRTTSCHRLPTRGFRCRSSVAVHPTTAHGRRRPPQRRALGLSGRGMRPQPDVTRRRGWKMVAERRSPDAEGSMAATAAATRATFRMPKTVASALDGGRSRAFLFFDLRQLELPHFFCSRGSSKREAMDV